MPPMISLTSLCNRNEHGQSKSRYPKKTIPYQSSGVRSTGGQQNVSQGDAEDPGSLTHQEGSPFSQERVG